MFARGMVRINGLSSGAMGGTPVLSQNAYAALTTVGAGQWLVGHLATGILNRTGPVGGFADTTPTADQILAAFPDAQPGDSFCTIFRNTVAFAMTMTAGAGITKGANADTAASSVNEYLWTFVSVKRTAIVTATTTNANAVLTNVRDVDIQKVMPGMLATGVGIGAAPNAVLGAALGVLPDTGTITLAVNSTATTDNIAVTFTPQITVEGVRLCSL